MVKGDLAGGVNGVDLAVMHLIRGHETDPGVVMVLIVPIEEAAAETSGVFDAAETFWEFGLVFQGFEVAFGEGIVPRLRRGRLLDVCGRLCDRVTPRSASKKAVAFARIGPPRSAWSVS
jgi:hypothetical protein